MKGRWGESIVVLTNVWGVDFEQVDGFFRTQMRVDGKMSWICGVAAKNVVHFRDILSEIASVNDSILEGKYSLARLLRVASRVPPAVFRMTLTRASRRPFSRRGRRAIPSQRSASLRPSSTAARSPTPSASRTSGAARRAARTPSTTSATRSSRSSGACCRRPRSRSSSRTPPSAARPSSRSSTRTRWRRRRSEPVVKSQVRALALTGAYPILPDLRRCASLPCITSIE